MRQFENADSKLNQHRIRAPRPSCSNIRLAKWNKTERNTPGVPGLVVDNQALATTRTERPFHFAFDDPAEYSGVVRSNPSLHTRDAPGLPPPGNTVLRAKFFSQHPAPLSTDFRLDRGRPED